MEKFDIIILLLFIFYFQSEVNAQEIINIGTNSTFRISNKNTYFNLTLSDEELNQGNILVISTTPEEDFLKPGFIYASLSGKSLPSPDNRNYSSQEMGRNILYISKTNFSGNKNLYLCIKSLDDTNIRLEVSIINEIPLEEFPGIRHKMNLSEISNDLITFTNKKKMNKKILFYALGENYKFFNMKVQYESEFDVKQRFENGYGVIVDFTADEFKNEENPKIKIFLEPSNEIYKERKVEIGYEIIDEEEEYLRKVEIMEHVYGMSESKETCYQFDFNKTENKNAIMLINSFTPGIKFLIRNSNLTKIYSLDIFNNYFIRLPNLVFDEGNYFCFKHTTPKDSEQESDGEVSFDFQIYYEDELYKYQMFIMPLINGKIYTHSLNRGDIMVYRHNYYNNEGDKKILSANMLRIRGNPVLYGFTCNDYPNCQVNKDSENSEMIPSSNMYYINKRLNAEGNTKIENEAVSELKNQYLTVVSCESDEKDPNNGECKYTIEINNEKDEIQLIPETIFATSIISPENYFLIRLNDYVDTTEYLKIHFTVFTGNAEMYIYTDKEYKNELDEEDYEFSHIHRKEIIEIKKDLAENYYIKIICKEPSFIQLKYETNEHYKGYENLMPNEVNIVPLNKYTNSYYNVFNPHYYYPLNNENRNNDFYYKVFTMDCLMGCTSDPGQIYYGRKEFGIERERNKLYEYLSSYGFAGRVQSFTYSSSEKENCGLIIYNGEKSKNIPLLINSDMPHVSTFENNYYVYPFTYDENNDQGIIIEFKIYDADDSKEDDLYSVGYGFIENGNEHQSSGETISKNTVIYANKGEYHNICKNNIFCILEIRITKNYPNRKYYITTNVMTAKISPEYINSNENYQFYLRPGSSKYFYGQIGKNSEGYIKFNNIPQNLEVYAKIVEKNKVEANYNWNKRVKLPESGDSDLLNLEKDIINYDRDVTSKCKEGCEIYIHIHSTIDINPNTKITEKDLISISFYLSQETNVIEPNYEENEIEIDPISPPKYIIKAKEDLGDNKLILLTITPNDKSQPVFLYASPESDSSFDKRDFSSQELGKNSLFLSTKYIKEGKKLYISINSLALTKADFKVELIKSIELDKKNDKRLKKIKLKLDDITSDLITFTKTNSKIKRMLFYALGENCKYFRMKVRHQNTDFEVKQRFENGLGAIVDFDSDEFKGEENPKVNIILEASDEKYKDRNIEINFDMVGSEEEYLRPVNIMEHIWGITDMKHEICYRLIDDNEKKRKGVMLINSYSPGINMFIKDSSIPDKLYSIDIFNNYFIRLPNSFFVEENYFCFKHMTPKDSEQESDGEVSFDFQIYYEDELYKYQMFIMPLINGKIYTHSLNRGDIMVYRHNYYNNEGDKKILSANMLRIRGNPVLYGFTCNDYPNCQVNKDTLANLEKITPLNMYYINKRINAEGNKIENEAVSELKNQYLTIVSCESDEKDPNNGECKYTIEINNEKDEIQLIPETIFATSIISPENYFLIRLNDYVNTTEYLKIYFTVFTGNAEMYIYIDKEYENELKDYEFSHIHRKEIIEIKNDIKENYYIKIKCSEPAFIQLKYETNQHYKGYYNLMPNEVNFEPLNQISKSYYNFYNPHYYYPLENEQRNKDFYYNIYSIDCSMNCGHLPEEYSYGVTNHSIYKEKNILYEYLSTYGFHGKVNNFKHTSSEKDKCGLIIYNGEKSENTPLLINSDMPHKSAFEYNYYIYPFIYDENNDKGIIIDFKIHDVNDKSQKNLFKISYGFIGNKNGEFSEFYISSNTVIYKDKTAYHDLCKTNILCKLSINIKKQYPDQIYYITTNIMNTEISPEYIYSNQNYEFKLRPISSKYFYSSINVDSDGYIKFNNIPKNVKLYAKIVENNKVEDNYNWNKRVRLPDEGVGNLLNIKDGVIQYNKEETNKCKEGCELYFHIKSINDNSNLKISENDLISLSFIFKEEKYEGNEKSESDGDSDYLWVIILVAVLIVIIAFGIFFLIMRRKRIYSSDIDQKDVNELSMTLE